MQRHLRQDPLGADGAADLGHAELQHVHLAQVEEQEAAAVLGGDLGRSRRVHGPASASPRRAGAALARGFARRRSRPVGGAPRRERS